jgi:hypothetical protein
MKLLRKEVLTKIRETDKPHYLAGDTVTGHVYLNITNLFPGDSVFLKFKGIESSWWRESY